MRKSGPDITKEDDRYIAVAQFARNTGIRMDNFGGREIIQTVLRNSDRILRRALIY